MSGTPADRAALVRRTLIEIATRRQRPGSGSLLESPTKVPMILLPELVATLSGVPWAIVGAVAAGRYMPERTTRDVDIAILPRDRPEVSRRLEAAGYSHHGNLSIGSSTWTAADGSPLDVIEGREQWWPVALEAAGANAGADGVPILPAPYLVLMKSLASRVQDLADVTRILGRMSDADLDEVRALVRVEAPLLSEDIESLIVLGRLEQG